ncbi:hypothetical protein SLEP1_g15454 [Rubroshorea leprosula]|uniref:Mitochondrial protein n=1 Tax=Rubroshorea leprosula TaxID=152421 RepID=A0AAV5ITF3_9ROSI|nr:hypothetical protein SLEP1_g15454 [Rubroshorea leprosula]
MLYAVLSLSIQPHLKSPLVPLASPSTVPSSVVPNSSTIPVSTLSYTSKSLAYSPLGPATSPLAVSRSPVVATSLPFTHDLSSHVGDLIAARSLLKASEVLVVNSSVATIPSSSDHSMTHGARTHSMVTWTQDGTCKVDVLPSLLVTDCALREPRNFKEASKDSDWCTTMAEEFSALLRNNSWSLVPCPSNANIVGLKWVYCIK